MDLLQSVITNSYPSITVLLKFWLNQAIDFFITILTTFPINVSICVIVVVMLVYKGMNRLFGDKMFRAKYEPLRHKQNLINDAKTMKKQIRQLQSEIIDIRKKLSNTKPNDPFMQQYHNQNSQMKSQQQTNQMLGENVQLQINKKIIQGEKSIKFNETLQVSLKQSSEQIIRTLKEINERS